MKNTNKKHSNKLKNGILYLKGGDLSILYPFVALTYIWVSLLSVKFLGEKMNLIKKSKQKEKFFSQALAKMVVKKFISVAS